MNMKEPKHLPSKALSLVSPLPPSLPPSPVAVAGRSTRSATDPQRRVIDQATRQRRQQRQLDALERDNCQDDPHAAFAHLAAKAKLPAFADNQDGERQYVPVCSCLISREYGPVCTYVVVVHMCSTNCTWILLFLFQERSEKRRVQMLTTSSRLVCSPDVWGHATTCAVFCSAEVSKDVSNPLRGAGE